MAKKKQSQNAENVQNAYDAYQSEVQQAGQNVVEGMQTAGAQQLADLEAANNAYNEANNAAIEANRQQSNAAIGSFADMVNQYAENIRRAEDEGAAQVAASQRAARWAGATELASSIANLVAVGGHNAVSQQYRPFSQDWMRKADQDARMNRMRIDNLRERRRAMQGQLANLRLNDAARALELAREQAKTNYQQGLTMAETRYNTTINPLNQAARNAEAVGKIGVQAASDVASTAQRDRQLDQSAASLAQRQREHNAEMMAKGYNPDGTINEKAMSEIVKAQQGTKTTKDSGKDKSFSIPLKEYKGLPKENLTIESPEALQTTIYANIEGITDLDQNDLDKIKDIIENDELSAKKKSEELQRFMVKSDQLRSLFRTGQQTNVKSGGRSGNVPEGEGTEQDRAMTDFWSRRAD